MTEPNFGTQTRVLGFLGGLTRKTSTTGHHTYFIALSIHLALSYKLKDILGNQNYKTTYRNLQAL